jgi:hypothetical protein
LAAVFASVAAHRHHHHGALLLHLAHLPLCHLVLHLLLLGPLLPLPHASSDLPLSAFSTEAAL